MNFLKDADFILVSVFPPSLVLFYLLLVFFYFFFLSVFFFKFFIEVVCQIQILNLKKTVA